MHFIELPFMYETETRVVTFGFARLLSGTDTIASAPNSITARVHSGTDATPASRLYSTPQLSGSDVKQTVKNPLGGVVYDLECSATTTNGETLTIIARLRVESVD